MTVNEQKNDNELIEILVEIDTKIDLARKGLLLNTELHETQRKTEDILSKNIKADTELWRDYDRHKTTTYWEKYPRGKYTNEIGRLPLWRDFVVKTLEAQGLQENKKQTLIQKGQNYTARKILRDILKNAKNKIDIQDNYINIEILSILEEYVIENSNLLIRILTQNTNNSYKSDLSTFIKQYGSVVETKINTECHDRFIIIDGIDVYHSGHSFKDLGSKASLISIVDDKKEKDAIINEFEKWWQSGTNI